MRKLDYRSMRLRHGYDAFESYGPCSVDKALTTAQRDALPVDDLRAGDRIWNITTQTLQVWNGTAWVDVGGGGAGGHLGIDGETLASPLRFQDHDKYNTSWMWRWQTKLLAVLADLTVEGPDWFCNDTGMATPPFGSCYSTPSNGSILPYGLDALGMGGGPSDGGLMRNILVIPPDGVHAWCPQYLMVKGFSVTTDDGIGGSDPTVVNVVIGFAGQPFQGLVDSTVTTFNTGVFFAAGDGVTITTPSGPLALTDNWYACVANATAIYAKNTGVPITTEKHKFFVEWHGDAGVVDGNAKFYIDDVLKSTITKTESSTAWPDLVGYPTLGVSNTDPSPFGVYYVYPQVFLPFIHATDYTPDVPPPI